MKVLGIASDLGGRPAASIESSAGSIFGLGFGFDWSGVGAMSDFILQTSRLTKEFKGFTAVSDVNLSVRRGAIHALIGPNGAGKTTCFNLLTKFLEPTSGVIRFNGHDITRERPAHPSSTLPPRFSAISRGGV